MKKILFATLVLCFLLALSGCNSHKKGDLVYNDTHHWYACRHKSCDARLEEGEHSWDKGEVIKEAAEGTEGLKVYFCTFCNGTKNEKIAPLPKVSITESGWASAFSKDSFLNVTATLAEEIQSGDTTYKIEYKILADNALVYLTVIRYENDREVGYSAKFQDGYYQWSFTTREEKLEDVSPQIASSQDVMTAENILKNYNLDFTGLFNGFSYDSSEKCYVAKTLTVGDEEMTDVIVYMLDGKISHLSAIVGNGEKITVELSDYGKTVPKR